MVFELLADAVIGGATVLPVILALNRLRQIELMCVKRQALDKCLEHAICTFKSN